jgi:hypothetical protein
MSLEILEPTLLELPCKEWSGKRNQNGYGYLHVPDTAKVKGYRQVFAHRHEWQIHNGEIPNGMCICHKCDNPPCYEISHLFLGSKADNNSDMLSKGRHVPPRGEICGNASLTAEKVLEMRRLFTEENLTRKQIAAQFGVGYRCVTDIINRRNWKHL